MSWPLRRCPDCQIVMTVTGAEHVYGLPIVSTPNALREQGLAFRVAVIPYFCADCGLVRLYSAKTLQRLLGSQNQPEPSQEP